MASEAARIGSLGEQDYADIIYNPELTREQDIRTRLLRSTYGTGEQAAENRLNLARFLSLQRPGGGTYGGAIGQALGRTVDELQSAYQARRPVGVDGQDFLSFYLQQTNPNAPVSGV